MLKDKFVAGLLGFGPAHPLRSHALQFVPPLVCIAVAVPSLGKIFEHYYFTKYWSETFKVW